jgi:hypothetical protein
MKKIFTLLFTLVYLHSIIAQKASIDTELLSTIIAQKQREVKKKVIADIVYKNAKTADFINYATYNTFYACINALTKTTNKQQITKDIIRELSLYIAANSITDNFIKNNNIPTSTYSDITTQRRNIQGYYPEFHKTSEKNIEKALKNSNYMERSCILDSIYYTLFHKLDSSDVNDLKPNRKYINNGLDFEENDEYKIDITKKPQLTILINKINKNIDDAESIIKLKNYDSIRELQDKDIIFIKKNILLIIDKIQKENKSQAADLERIFVLAKIIVNSINIITNDEHPEHQYQYKNFNIDIEAIILSLEEEFFYNKTVMKRTILWGIGVKPDFSIGLNYLYFGNATNGQADFSNQIIANTGVNYVALASEKIGVKFMFFDTKYTHSFEPGEWYQYKGKRSYRMWDEPVSKNPIITHGYLNAYFSGLLYNVVDLKTDKQFDYTFFGAGGGLTFFNNLDVNLGVGWVMKDKFMELNQNNLFYSLSFDIPIFEYIKALRDKNK